MAILIQQIDEAIELCKAKRQNIGSYLYLPAIIKSLEKMKVVISDNQKYDKHQLNKTAAALGRIVMEDFNFSESELGTLLLKIADDFAERKF